MDIQSISVNKFVVVLNSEDLMQLDITYDEMDYSNIETRRVIWTILDTVRQSTGRDVDPSGNIVIEAAPDNSGGCLLMFTIPASLGKIGTVISKGSLTRIYEFENENDLLDVSAALGRDCACGRIFTDGKRFRVEFPADKVSLCCRIIEEYGSFIGKDDMTIASTHEHWREVGNLSP